MVIASQLTLDDKTERKVTQGINEKWSARLPARGGVLWHDRARAPQQHAIALVVVRAAGL